MILALLHGESGKIFNSAIRGNENHGRSLSYCILTTIVTINQYIVLVNKNSRSNNMRIFFTFEISTNSTPSM